MKQASPTNQMGNYRNDKLSWLLMFNNVLMVLGKKIAGVI